MDFELTEENFYLFAAKNYYNPKYIDVEEFEEELDGDLDEFMEAYLRTKN